MAATLFRHLNEQGFHDNNRDFKSRTLFVGGETGVRLLSLNLFFTSVANKTKNLNVWSKLNQWAKIP